MSALRAWRTAPRWSRACIRGLSSGAPSPTAAAGGGATGSGGPARRAAARGGPGSGAGAGAQLTKEQPPRNGLLARLLAPGPDGRNSFLAALGYYSVESRAIGAGRTLYEQALAAAQAAPPAADCDGQLAPFAARYEMLAVHVYVVLRRLRGEKGAPHESAVTKGMQTLFDVFWSDVRGRMLIQEEGLRLIPSGKWVKECEQRFFGMAISFDECLDTPQTGVSVAEALRRPVMRNITCLEQDPAKAALLADYIWENVKHHERVSFDEMWEHGLQWTPLKL